MFVKITTRYNDMQLGAELPAGVILDVPAARAEALISAKVAEEFKFPTQTKPNTKQDKIVGEVKTETSKPTKEKTVAVQETAAPVADAWHDPKTTEPTNE